MAESECVDMKTINFKMPEFSGVISLNLEGDDITYSHILTGSPCEWIDQIFQGWSEPDPNDNEKWDELKRRVEAFDLVYDYLFDEPEGTVLGIELESDEFGNVSVL
jgi:hypothetical protein